MAWEKRFFVIGLRRSGLHPIAGWLVPCLYGTSALATDSNMDMTSPWPMDAYPEGDPFAADNFIATIEDSGAPVHAPTWSLRPDDRLIFVLRDIRNCFASRLKLFPQAAIDPTAMDVWKGIANEYLGKTNYLSELPCMSKIILYDLWFTSQEYRKKICAELSIDFSDKYLNKVHYQGDGSSFDKLAFDGRAQEMGVLERYKRDDYDRKKLDEFLAAHPEMLADNDRIFGPISQIKSEAKTDTQKVAGAIELLLAQLNGKKLPEKYWYPLSMPTYGSDEIVEAVDSMVKFKTSMWEKVSRFEGNFARYSKPSPEAQTGAVMVNSGSSADLLLCFLMTNPLNPLLRPGDEVLAPIVTWPTQLWSPLMAGLNLKLVDADPKTLNMSMDDLEAKITDKTKAIFVVHLMGNPCDMDRVMDLAKKHNLVVIEDCCEALGSEFDGKKVGTFGLGGAYSFFFSHHITTMEGGMIVVNDSEALDHLKILRAHGWVRNVDPAKFPLESYDLDPRYAFVNWGFNVRPTEIQAGFGLHQLKKLDEFNWTRNSMAERFKKEICGPDSPLTFPETHPKAKPAWFALPLMIKPNAGFSRKRIIEHLEANGVETRPIVAGNLAKQPAARLFKGFEGEFPGADLIHSRGFYVGLSPMQTPEAIEKLIKVFKDFFSQ